MKLTHYSARLFLVAAACMIFGAAGARRAAAQEAVDLPSFTPANTLTLERYPYQWNTPAGNNVRTQLFDRLSDGDVIHVSRRRDAVAADRLEIVLEAGSLVTWWKGITLYKKIATGPDAGKWRRVQHVSTQDRRRRSVAISVDVRELGGTALSLEKAKAFGAHTPMYVIHLDDRRDDLGGQRITFTWEKDR